MVAADAVTQSRSQGHRCVAECCCLVRVYVHNAGSASLYIWLLISSAYAARDDDSGMPSR
jgi:hypothetical protein